MADPDLKPGFPLAIPVPLGFTMAVGNMDSDPAQEIVVTTASQQGPETLVLKPNGTILGRISKKDESAIRLGNLSSRFPGLELFARVVEQSSPNRVITMRSDNAYSGDGTLLADLLSVKWKTGSVPQIPILADIDGDGIDEVFEGQLAPTKADGTPLFAAPNPANYNALAVGDMDGDGKTDILSQGARTYLKAMRPNGTVFREFVPRGGDYDDATSNSGHVMGDMDGDGQAEVVVLRHNLLDQSSPELVEIWSVDGALKGKIELHDIFGDARFALGDLDCDSLPEIVMQIDTKIYAWKADGSPLVGWPQEIHAGIASGPLIGDVDGDGYADVVAIDALHAELKAFDRHGNLLVHFPKDLPGGVTASMALAIADLDGDGRNDIIATTPDRTEPAPDGSEPQGYVWAFDLHGAGPYGPAQWGQWRGGPGGQGYYKSQPQPCRP